MEGGKPTLGYWKIRGMASGLRYQMIYQGVEFNMEEHEQGPGPAFSRTPWTDKKFGLGLDFPNLPYFKHGEHVMTETIPIHLFIADKWMSNLLGEDTQHRAKVNMLAGPIGELKGAVTMPCYMSTDRTKAVNAINQRLPDILRFQGDNKFLTQGLSWLDFFFFELTYLMKYLKPDLFETFPQLKLHFDAMRNLKNLKEYLANPESIDNNRQFNNRQALINNNVHYTLHYFNLYGRGEPIKMLLNKANVKYTLNEFTFATWPAIKPTMPNGVVPCLELNNGKKMGETLPLLRFLATQHGFYPEDFEKAQLCDSLADYAQGTLNNLVGPVFIADPKAKAAAIDNVFDKIAPAIMKAFDKDMKHGKFLVGDELCYADFFIGGIYTNWFTNPKFYAPERWTKLMNEYPNFKAYGERFKKEMADYLSSDKRIDSYV